MAAKVQHDPPSPQRCRLACLVRNLWHPPARITNKPYTTQAFTQNTLQLWQLEQTLLPSIILTFFPPSCIRLLFPTLRQNFSRMYIMRKSLAPQYRDCSPPSYSSQISCNTRIFHFLSPHKEPLSLHAKSLLHEISQCLSNYSST